MRRPLAIGLAIASGIAAPAARADAEVAGVAGTPDRPSEYRVYLGARHQGELFTADVLTAGRLALRGVDALETAAIHDPPSLAGKAVRVAGFVFVDLPIMNYTIVLPHEAFGHATRAREFDAHPRIVFDLPTPYSLRVDDYVEVRPTRPLYIGELSVVGLGGLEAQEASQRMIAWTAFRSGVLRRGEALLYSTTSLGHAAQMLVGSDFEKTSEGVRPLYRADPHATRTAARAALALDAVDPMLLYSWYAASVDWLWHGEAATAAPSLDRGSARFFATSRTMPVPWGVEHELHVLAGLPLASFDLGLRTGFGARGSFGAEVTTFDWRLLRVMRAGAELAFWVQPEVPSAATLGLPAGLHYLGGVFATRTTLSAPVVVGSSIGGAARILLELDQPSWFLGTRLGWKSAGLWGERDLAEGFDIALTGGMKLD